MKQQGHSVPPLSAWGAFLLRRRRPAILATAGLSLLAVGGLARVEFQDSTRALFRAAPADLARLHAADASFGSQEDLAVVLFEGDNVLAAAVLTEVSRIAAALRRLPGVEWVFGIDDLLERDPALADAPERLLSHPLVEGQLVCADASCLLLLVRTREAGTSILHLKPLLSRLRALVRPDALPGVRVSLTGIPFLRLEAIEAIRRAALATNALALALCVLVAATLLRSLRRVGVAIVGPVVGVPWLIGALGWLGVPITPLTLAAPALILAVGLTDSVHLLHAYDRARAGGLDPHASTLAALDLVLVPCVLTSLTTCLGFGALALVDVGIVRQFGLACAGGSLLVAAAVLTFVPLLTARGLADRRHSMPDPVTSRRLMRWLRGSCRVPVRVAAAGGALVALLGISALRLEPDYAMAEVLPDASPAYEALQRIESDLGGAIWVNVYLAWPAGLDLGADGVLESIGAVHDLLEEEAIAHAPLSIRTVLRAVPRISDDPLFGVPPALRDALVDTDARRALILARVHDAGSRVLEAGFARIERGLVDLESRFPGFELALTGANVLTYRGIGSLIHDLARSLLIAMVLITVVVGVAFRSARTAVASIMPNAFPVLAGAATLAWVGEPLRYASAMVLTVALGIAVDDTIHIAYRFRGERERGGRPEAAAARAVVSLAPALLVSTLILVAGFMALITHPMFQGRLFGALGAATLLFALAGDLLLLPSLLILIAAPVRRRRSRA